MKIFRIIAALMLGILIVLLVPSCNSSDETVNGEPTGDQNGVKLGDEFQLALGQGVEITNIPLDIVFKRVISDSRCPQDVTCIWQGEVSVEIEIIDGDSSQLLTLTQPGLFYDYSKAAYETYEILFKVLPYPESEKQITDDEYRLVMKVTKETNQIKGIIRGHVIIGPIKPVVQPGDDPNDIPPEVYDARKIMVYDESGNELIEQVDIGHDGNYSIDLIPGTYVIDINNIGIDRSSDVPKEIELGTGEEIILDIDIDTGIR